MLVKNSLQELIIQEYVFCSKFFIKMIDEKKLLRLLGEELFLLLLIQN